MAVMKGKGTAKAASKKAPSQRSAKQVRDAAAVKICEEPVVPVREFTPDIGPERASLIRNSDKKWANGTKLHYHFLTSPSSWAGTTAHRRRVRDGFRAWNNVGIGLDFEEASSPDDAEIRIAFERNAGHWSYVGRDVLGIAQSDRTMNLDKDDAWPVDTAIHEIGHTLGFPHEHQNPNAGIVWNEEAVYADLAGPPNNWSRQKTHHNIIRKLDPSGVRGSAWDKDSIMHYPFKAGLIDRPVRYRTLEPFQFVRLSLEPRQQANFVIRATATRRYRFSTFGRSDTVMVLFERVNGMLRFSMGDDDSGFDRNASFTARLFQGRTYYLRIRLYYQHRRGELGVMMW